MKKKFLVVLSFLLTIIFSISLALPIENIFGAELATIAQNNLGSEQIIGASQEVQDCVNGIAIETTEQFVTCLSGQEVTKVYVLRCDIDLTGQNWQPIKTNNGRIYGNGYTITFDASSPSYLCKENYGTISNMVLKNCRIGNISIDDVTYYGVSTRGAGTGLKETYRHFGYGAVACVNYGTISYCQVNEPTIKIDSDLDFGIPSQVFNSYTFKKPIWIGGIAGINVGDKVRISACVVNDITDAYEKTTFPYVDFGVGGIVGYNATIVEYCIASLNFHQNFYQHYSEYMLEVNEYFQGYSKSSSGYKDSYPYNYNGFGLIVGASFYTYWDFIYFFQFKLYVIKGNESKIVSCYGDDKTKKFLYNQGDEGKIAIPLDGSYPMQQHAAYAYSDGWPDKSILGGDTIYKVADVKEVEAELFVYNYSTYVAHGEKYVREYTTLDDTCWNNATIQVKDSFSWTKDVLMNDTDVKYFDDVDGFKWGDRTVSGITYKDSIGKTPSISACDVTVYYCETNDMARRYLGQKVSNTTLSGNVLFDGLDTRKYVSQTVPYALLKEYLDKVVKQSTGVLYNNIMYTLKGYGTSDLSDDKNSGNNELAVERQASTFAFSNYTREQATKSPSLYPVYESVEVKLTIEYKADNIHCNSGADPNFKFSGDFKTETQTNQSNASAKQPEIEVSSSVSGNTVTISYEALASGWDWKLFYDGENEAYFYIYGVMSGGSSHISSTMYRETTEKVVDGRSASGYEDPYGQAAINDHDNSLSRKWKLEYNGGGTVGLVDAGNAFPTELEYTLTLYAYQRVDLKFYTCRDDASGRKDSVGTGYALVGTNEAWIVDDDDNNVSIGDIVKKKELDESKAGAIQYFKIPDKGKIENDTIFYEVEGMGTTYNLYGYEDGGKFEKGKLQAGSDTYNLYPSYNSSARVFNLRFEKVGEFISGTGVVAKYGEKEVKLDAVMRLDGEIKDTGSGENEITIKYGTSTVYKGAYTGDVDELKFSITLTFTGNGKGTNFFAYFGSTFTTSNLISENMVPVINSNSKTITITWNLQKNGGGTIYYGELGTATLTERESLDDTTNTDNDVSMYFINGTNYYTKPSFDNAIMYFVTSPETPYEIAILASNGSIKSICKLDDFYNGSTFISNKTSWVFYAKSTVSLEITYIDGDDNILGTSTEELAYDAKNKTPKPTYVEGKGIGTYGFVEWKIDEGYKTYLSIDGNDTSKLNVENVWANKDNIPMVVKATQVCKFLTLKLQIERKCNDDGCEASLTEVVIENIKYEYDSTKKIYTNQQTFSADDIKTDNHVFLNWKIADEYANYAEIITNNTQLDLTDLSEGAYNDLYRDMQGVIKATAYFTASDFKYILQIEQKCNGKTIGTKDVQVSYNYDQKNSQYPHMVSPRDVYAQDYGLDGYKFKEWSYDDKYEDYFSKIEEGKLTLGNLTSGQLADLQKDYKGIFKVVANYTAERNYVQITVENYDENEESSISTYSVNYYFTQTRAEAGTNAIEGALYKGEALSPKEINGYRFKSWDEDTDYDSYVTSEQAGNLYFSDKNMASASSVNLCACYVKLGVDECSLTVNVHTKTSEGEESKTYRYLLSSSTTSTTDVNSSASTVYLNGTISLDIDNKNTYMKYTSTDNTFTYNKDNKQIKLPENMPQNNSVTINIYYELDCVVYTIKYVDESGKSIGVSDHKFTLNKNSQNVDINSYDNIKKDIKNFTFKQFDIDNNSEYIDENWVTTVDSVAGKGVQDVEVMAVYTPQYTCNITVKFQNEDGEIIKTEESWNPIEDSKFTATATINNYTFAQWDLNGYDTWFSASEQTLTFEKTLSENSSFTIFAKYSKKVEEKVITVRVKTKIDGVATSDEDVYMYYYSSDSQAGTNILSVGSTLTASEQSGYEFAWDVSEATFVAIMSNVYKIKFTAPSGTVPNSVTIYKTYTTVVVHDGTYAIIKFQFYANPENHYTGIEDMTGYGDVHTIYYYYKDSTGYFSNHAQNKYSAGETIYFSDLNADIPASAVEAMNKHEPIIVADQRWAKDSNSELILPGSMTISGKKFSEISMKLKKDVESFGNDSPTISYLIAFEYDLDIATIELSVRYKYDDSEISELTKVQQFYYTDEFLGSDKTDKLAWGDSLISTSDTSKYGKWYEWGIEEGKEYCAVLSGDYSYMHKIGSNAETSIAMNTKTGCAPLKNAGGINIKIVVYLVRDLLRVEIQNWDFTRDQAISDNIVEKAIAYNGNTDYGGISKFANNKYTRENILGYVFDGWVVVDGVNIFDNFMTINGNEINVKSNIDISGIESYLMSGELVPIQIRAGYSQSRNVNLHIVTIVDGESVEEEQTVFYYQQENGKIEGDTNNAYVGYGKEFVATKTVDGYSYATFVKWQADNVCCRVDGNTLTLQSATNIDDDLYIYKYYETEQVQIQITHRYLTDCKESDGVLNKVYTDGNNYSLQYLYVLDAFNSSQTVEGVTRKSNKYYVDKETTYDSQTYTFSHWHIVDYGVVTIDGEDCYLNTSDNNLKGRTVEIIAYYEINYVEITLKDMDDTEVVLKFDYTIESTTLDVSTNFDCFVITESTRASYLNLFTEKTLFNDEIGKFTHIKIGVVETKDNLQGIYKLTILKYKETSDDVARIIIDIDYGDGEEEEKIIDFYYTQSSSQEENNKVKYLGQSYKILSDEYRLVQLTIADDDRKWFADIDGSTLYFATTTPSGVTGGAYTVNITVEAMRKYVKITVNYKHDDNDLGDTETVAPSVYYFYYDEERSENSLNTDDVLYQNENIVAPNKLGYRFGEWEFDGSESLFVVDTNNANRLQLVGGVISEYEATITAHYVSDDANVEVIVKAYLHPETIDKKIVETTETTFNLYYKRNYRNDGDDGYCLGETIEIDDIDIEFEKSTAVFVTWMARKGQEYYTIFNDGKNLQFKNALYDVINENEIVLEAHFVYLPNYKAIFKIYSTTMENNSYSDLKEETTKYFNFATGSEGLAYDEVVANGSAMFGSSFVKWKVPTLGEKGTSDYKNLFAYSNGVINEIKTCASAPSMESEEYEIVMIAVLQINKVKLTLNYKNNKTGENIADSVNYVLYYNGSMKIDESEDAVEIYGNREINRETIIGYNFKNWQISNLTDFNKFFSYDNDKIKVKADVTQIDMSGELELEVNALYWPQEIITIKVKTKTFEYNVEDGSIDYYVIDESKTETYYYYYSDTSYPSGTYNLGAGDTITAGTISGYSFDGWDLNGNQIVFENYSTGYIITTRTIHESGSREIEIYKTYEPNQVIFRHYQYYLNGETNQYEWGETSIYKYDYENNTMTTLYGEKHFTYVEDDDCYSFDYVTVYNYANYTYADYKIVADKGIENFLNIYNLPKIETRRYGTYSGTYEIDVTRYYDINRAYFSVMYKVDDEEPQMMSLTDSPFERLADGRYLYSYDTTINYTFPTNIDTASQKYVFKSWQIEKILGNADYMGLLTVKKDNDGNIITIGTTSSSVCEKIYHISLVALYEKINNVCVIEVKYQDENDEDIFNLSTSDYPTQYNFYYSIEGTANGTNLYLGNTILSKDIAGYEFVEWGVLIGDKYFTFEKGKTTNPLQLATSQPLSDDKTFETGEKTAQIVARYKKYYCEITINYKDNAGVDIASKEVVKFFYGLNRPTGNDEAGVYYLGESIQIKNINGYSFTKWEIDGEYKDVFISSSETNLEFPLTPVDTTGNYSLNVVARYSENACYIAINYLDIYNNDLSSVETVGLTQYRFMFGKGTQSDAILYYDSKIIAPEKVGYLFVGWEMADEYKQYFDEDGNTLTLLNCDDSKPSGDMLLIARYEEDVLIIDIEYRNERGTRIIGSNGKVYSKQIKYYYRETLKTDGIKFDSDNNANNEIVADVIDGYTFVKWTESSIFLKTEDSNQKLYLISVIEGERGTLTTSVVAHYTNKNNAYIIVNVDNVHWEDAYYLNKEETLVTKQYRYYYNKGVFVDSIGTECDTISSIEIANMIFRNWKQVSGTKICGDILDTDLYVLSESEQVNYIDKEKLGDINILQMKYEDMIASETIYKSLTFGYPYSDAMSSQLDKAYFDNDITLNIVAYHTKAINIKTEGVASESANITVKDIPVNYIVDKHNFGGEVEDTFDYKVDGLAVYGYTQEYNLSSDVTNDKLNIVYGEAYDYYVKSFGVNADVDIDSEIDVDDYTPSNYKYVGWGKYAPTPEMHSALSSLVFNLTNIDNRLKSYIQNLQYNNKEIAWGDDSYSFDLYMQWRADTFEIVIYVDEEGTTDEYVIAEYFAEFGEIGDEIYAFENTIVTDSNFANQMKNKKGTIGYWKITKINDGAEIFDESGSLLQVGDSIEKIYANSHGNFEIAPVIVEYTDLALKFDYNISVAKIGTQAFIYNDDNMTRSGNVFVLSTKYQYNQQFNLASILKAEYVDPNPLTVTYNGVSYYLAGWTLYSSSYTPEGNWARLKYNNFVASYTTSCVDFTNVKNYSVDGNYIMAYNGGGFTHLVGNASSEIVLYGVWLPYYSITVYSVPMGNTDANNDADIYDAGELLYNGQNENKVTGYSISFKYGITIEKSSAILGYDIRTSYGQTPNNKYYSLALYGKILSGYKITNDTYYYGTTNYKSEWMSSASAVFTDIASSSSKSNVDLFDILESYLEEKMSYNFIQDLNIKVYPVWEHATITIDNTNSMGEEQLRTVINLTGKYNIDYHSIENYSLDYMSTSTGKIIKYAMGYDFINFMDGQHDESIIGFGETITQDIEVKFDTKQYLYLKLNSEYAGDMYFLRIQSQEAYNTLPYEDSELVCEDAIMFTALNKYKYLKLNSSIDETLLSLAQIVNFPKTSYGDTYINDYSDIYEQCANQIVSDGRYFYLVAIYNQNVYDGNKNLQLGKIEHDNGSELEYYLYNNSAYDGLDYTKERKTTNFIRLDANYERYFNPTTANISVPNTWIYDGTDTISAVWRTRVYNVDLSVALTDGVVRYSDAGYLVAEAIDYKDRKQYYVLNYETTDGSNYEFRLYTLTESQYLSFGCYYNGWNTLKLDYEVSSRIKIEHGSVLNLWVFDQSKDINSDSLIGYRLKSVNIRNPKDTSAYVCLAGTESKISYQQEDNERVDYITTNGYLTTMDFTEIELDNNSTINLQAVLEYINYDLTAMAEEGTGIVSGVYQTKLFSNASYKFQQLRRGSEINVTFSPNLGYDIDCWTIDGAYVGDEAECSLVIDVDFLRTYMYANKTSYETSYETGRDSQSIGELLASAVLLEFDLRVNILTNDSEEIDSYILSENMDDSIISLSTLTRSSSTSNSKVKINSDSYVISINPNTSNGYKCYTYGGTDYAILRAYIRGGARSYMDVSYTFPVDTFTSGKFTVDSKALSELLKNYKSGAPVAEKDRVIDVYVQVAEIFEVKADSEEVFESLKQDGDYYATVRRLLAGNTTIAGALKGSCLTPTGSVHYAYKGQETSLQITTDSNYYSGGVICVGDKEFEVGLDKTVEIEVVDDTLVSAYFIPKTLVGNITIKYQSDEYDKDNYSDLKNSNGVQILKLFPTYTITDSDGNIHTQYISYADVLRFSFDDDNFNNDVKTSGELKDYSYNVYINGKVEISSNGEYTAIFSGDINVVIEIIPMSGNVLVYTNLYNASRIIAVTSTNKTGEISQQTMSFELELEEKLTIYALDCDGYEFVGISKNGGVTTRPITRYVSSGEYTGYVCFDLINRYDADKAGIYMIEYKAIEVTAELHYSVDGEDVDDGVAGTGFTIDKDKYVIYDLMTISKPLQNGEYTGYRFIGYSIGDSRMSANIIGDGKEQITVALADYAECIKDNKIAIYINYIKQYTIEFEVDANDFGQTSVRLENSAKESILTSTNVSEMPLKTKYMDETSYSKLRYTITVQSRDTTNYYLVLTANGQEMQLGQENCTYQLIDGSEHIYECKYTFDLDKHYLFEIQYYPVEYSIDVTTYLISDVDELTQYNKDLDTSKLDKVVDFTTPVTITNVSQETAYENCYGTSKVLTITIEDAPSDYVMLHVRINGVVQQITETSTENGKVYTLTYMITGDMEIEIVLKQIYEISVEQ